MMFAYIQNGEVIGYGNDAREDVDVSWQTPPGFDPSEGWVWDGNGLVRDPAKLLEIAKAEKRARITAERDAKLAAGFTFNGHLYHSDETFGSQLQAFLLAWQTGILPAGATVAIRRKDNTTVQMTQAEVTALAAALMQYVQQVYAESWTAKDALG